jgi:hypothetical protein
MSGLSNNFTVEVFTYTNYRQRGDLRDHFMQFIMWDFENYLREMDKVDSYYAGYVHPFPIHYHVSHSELLNISFLYLE